MKLIKAFAFLLTLSIALLMNPIRAYACCSDTKVVQTDCGGGSGCHTKYVKVCNGGSGDVWQDGTGPLVSCGTDCAVITAGICDLSPMRLKGDLLDTNDKILITNLSPALPTNCASLRGSRLEAYIDTLRIKQP